MSLLNHLNRTANTLKFCGMPRLNVVPVAECEGAIPITYELVHQSQ